MAAVAAVATTNNNQNVIGFVFRNINPHCLTLEQSGIVSPDWRFRHLTGRDGSSPHVTRTPFITRHLNPQTHF